MSEKEVPEPIESAYGPAELAPLVYEELRKIAKRYFRGERRSHTLQPTAVVHEAYLQLLKNTKMTWRSETHFRAMAAKQMRRVLIDYARRRLAREGRLQRVELEEDVAVVLGGTIDMLALDEALEKLSALDDRQGEIAELRLFSGLTELEIADAINVSERTVRADWRLAQAWLARELSR